MNIIIAIILILIIIYSLLLSLSSTTSSSSSTTSSLSSSSWLSSTTTKSLSSLTSPLLILDYKIRYHKDKDYFFLMLTLFYEKVKIAYHNSSRCVYGNDVKYMMDEKKIGLWQIPLQISSYLIKLVSFGNINTLLEIGTCSGATTTVMAIYLQRFGYS